MRKLIPLKNSNCICWGYKTWRIWIYFLPIQQIIFFLFFLDSFQFSCQRLKENLWVQFCTSLVVHQQLFDGTVGLHLGCLIHRPWAWKWRIPSWTFRWLVVTTIYVIYSGTGCMVNWFFEVLVYWWWSLGFIEEM